MEIADKILNHPMYMQYMNLNAESETDRQFCKHDLQHAFDVARVAYIINLERNLNINKDIIYAAALLHDIAKWKQYRFGTDHASEGSLLAGEILKDIGIDEKDAHEIITAIKTHRKSDLINSPLGLILYESDKSCRPCIFCKSIDTCNRFDDGKKPAFKY